MRRILVALAAAAVLFAVPVGAEERLATPSTHLVTPDIAQARLLEDLILLQFVVFSNYQGFLLVIK